LQQPTAFAPLSRKTLLIIAIAVGTSWVDLAIYGGVSPDVPLRVGAGINLALLLVFGWAALPVLWLAQTLVFVVQLSDSFALTVLLLGPVAQTIAAAALYGLCLCLPVPLADLQRPRALLVLALAAIATGWLLPLYVYVLFVNLTGDLALAQFGWRWLREVFGVLLFAPPAVLLLGRTAPLPTRLVLGTLLLASAVFVSAASYREKVHLAQSAQLSLAVAASRIETAVARADPAADSGARSLAATIVSLPLPAAMQGELLAPGGEVIRTIGALSPWSGAPAEHVQTLPGAGGSYQLRLRQPVLNADLRSSLRLTSTVVTVAAVLANLALLFWSGYSRRLREDVQTATASYAVAQRQLYQILDGVAAGVLGFAANGRVTYCNRNALTILGLQRDACLSAKIDDLLGPVVDHDGSQGALREAFTECRGVTGETTLQGAASQAVAVQYALLPIAGTTQTQSVLSFQDVRSRRLLRALQADKDRQFQTFFTQAPVPTLILDGEGTIAQCNHAALAFFDRAEGALAGCGLDQLFPLEQRAAQQASLANLLEGTGSDAAVASVSLELAAARGEVRQVDCVARGLQGETGAIFAVSLLDQTEQNAAREALMHSNRSLSQFAYVASHDLQEPLRTIRSYSDVLTEDCAGQLDETGQRCVDFMGKAARRASVLVEDLLRYSRLTASDMPRKPVSLDAVLARVLDDQAGAIERQQAQVAVAPLPAVRGNHSELAQLFGNLISNGIKFCPPQRQPQLRIQARRVGAWEEVSVADNGIGIPEADRERVFGMFSRLHSTNAYPGTGIGLSIVQGVMERCGGDVRLDASEAGGCLFRLRFPVLAEAEAYGERTMSEASGPVA
jgi:signal transduction histidine kinase